METYIALLRGVNVSGKNPVNMQKLRQLMAENGFDRVETYIQSGNIVFGCNNSVESGIASDIIQLIEKNFGLNVTVIVRSAAALNQIIVRNPFIQEPGIDISKLHCTLFAKTISESPVKQSDGADRYILLGDTAYVYCPDGYGRTKFSNNWFEKQYGCAATTRNIRTLQTLIEMAVARKN